MSMTETQWLALAFFVAGVVGFQRGWERALITSAIIAMTTLFLLIGGDIWLAQWLTDWQMIRVLPTVQEVHAVAAPLYGVAFVLAHMAGSRWGKAPKTHGHRWTGVIPGAVTGGAFLAYLNERAAPALISHSFASFFPVLFAIGVILHVFFLFMTARSHS